MIWWYRGKFGEVKRCVEMSTGREFAAKFIATPRQQDRKDVEHEVNMMGRLHHRRLVQLYDAFQSDKEMCLIIEMYDTYDTLRYFALPRPCLQMWSKVMVGDRFTTRENLFLLFLVCFSLFI